MATKTTREIFADMIEDFKSSLINGENPFLVVPQISGNTKKPYNGANKIFLGLIGREMNSNEWYTMKQVNLKKAKVNKGESATPIFFFQTATTATDPNGKKKWFNKPLKEAQEEHPECTNFKAEIVMKHYYVFNKDQTTLEEADTVSFSTKESAIITAVTDMGLKSDKADLYEFLDDALESYGKFDDIEFIEKQIVKIITISYISATLPTKKAITIDMEIVDILVERLNKNHNYLWKLTRYATQAYTEIIERANKEVAA